MIQYVKKFFPDEVSIQQRHDGPSDEVARRTVIAQIVQAGDDTGFARRKMILGSAGLATGIFGLGLGIAAVAPLVRNPWKGGIGRRAVALRLACRERGDGVPALRHR